MSPYRVLIAGLGQIGCGYDIDLASDAYVMTHARACHLHPALSIVGAVDPSEAARVSYARRYLGPTFSSFEAAAEVSPVDLLILASPTGNRPRLLSEALTIFSPKVVLCEKPLAPSLSEAASMVADCSRRGIQLFVNYMRCVEPGAVKAGRLLESRILAPPYTSFVWYSKGFLHNASHFWTLAERWFGPTRWSSVTFRDGDWGDHDARCGVRALHDCAIIHYLPLPDGPLTHHSMEVMAANGRLRYDHGGQEITWDLRVEGAAPTVLSRHASSIPSDFNRFQWHVADALVAALDGKAHGLCTAAEALGGLTRLLPLLEA